LPNCNLDCNQMVVYNIPDFRSAYIQKVNFARELRVKSVILKGGVKSRLVRILKLIIRGMP